jgi:hypothetical protein
MMPTSSRDTRYHRRRDWTDSAIVTGPTLRWIEDDYEDLRRAHPEVLLGYNVRLVPWSTLGGYLRGLILSKLVILDGGQDFPPEAMREVERQRQLGAQVEQWVVHRGVGIWRRA